MQRVSEVELARQMLICPPQLEHHAGNGRRPEDREAGLGLVEIRRPEPEQISPLALPLVLGRVDIALETAAHRRMHPAPVAKPKIVQWERAILLSTDCGSPRAVSAAFLHSSLTRRGDDRAMPTMVQS
jgi:hypothetical protein